MKRVFGHIRRNIVGYVAVLLALTTGVAFALERNSVRSKHIVNKQVKPRDLSKQYGSGVVMGRITGLDNTSETFATPIGESSTDSEQDRVTRWPGFKGGAARVTGFRVSLAGGPVAPGGERRFVLRSGGTSVLSCTVGEGDSACQSTGSGRVTAGAGAAIQILNTGNPGSHLAQYGYLVVP